MYHNDYQLVADSGGPQIKLPHIYEDVLVLALALNIVIM